VAPVAGLCLDRLAHQQDRILHWFSEVEVREDHGLPVGGRQTMEEPAAPVDPLAECLVFLATVFDFDDVHCLAVEMVQNAVLQEKLVLRPAHLTVIHLAAQLHVTPGPWIVAVTQESADAVLASGRLAVLAGTGRGTDTCLR